MTASPATAAEIAAAIAAADGNVTAAAAALGMSRSTLRRRIAATAQDEAAEATQDEAPAADLGEQIQAAQAEIADHAAQYDRAIAGANTAAPESDAAPAAPAGLVSPVRFYAILMDRNLAADGLTEGNVRNWFRKIVMGFPALNVTEDGTVHQAPVEMDGKRVSRPVVDLDAGLAWYAAYLARGAARMAARLAA